MAAEEPYADTDLSVLTSMPDLGRPWQLELTGDLDRLAGDKRTDAILIRLLDYMLNVSSIEIRADHHQVVVRRAFPSDKAGSVDALIAAFFKAVPAAKGSRSTKARRRIP